MSIGDVDFGVQVGIGVLGRVVTVLVAFLGSILLARILGPTGYGSFYLLLAIVALLDNPVTGWATACRKRLTETDFPSGEAVGSTVIAIIASSAVVFTLAWVARPTIASLTGHPAAWLYLAVLFVGSVTYATAQQVLQATRRFGSSTWLGASRDTVRVLVQAALVVAGFGVAGMVGGMVAANLVVAPIALYLIGARPGLPTAETLAEIWRFARSSVPAGFVGTAQEHMDILLLGIFVGTSVAGVYEIALKLTIPAMFVAGVAQNGLMGRVSNLRSRDEPVVADIENNLAYASVLGVPLFFGVLVLAEPVVVTVYSSQFVGAAPYLIGLALFRLLRTQRVILLATIDGFDRPDLNLKVSTAEFALNLALGLSLLFTVGPIGVVVATVVSEGVGYALRAVAVRSLAPSVTLLPKQIGSQVLSGAVMATVVAAGRAFLPLASWSTVLGLVALGGLTYFVTLIGLSRPFRTTIRAVAADAGLR